MKKFEILNSNGEVVGEYSTREELLLYFNGRLHIEVRYLDWFKDEFIDWVASVEVREEDFVDADDFVKSFLYKIGLRVELLKSLKGFDGAFRHTKALTDKRNYPFKLKEAAVTFREILTDSGFTWREVQL